MPNAPDGPSLRFDHVNVSCRPLLCGTAQLEMQLEASLVALTQRLGTDGRPVLALSSLGRAIMQFKVGTYDLNVLATALARSAAHTQGIDVQDVLVELRSKTSRDLRFQIHVRARKMLVTGVVSLTGLLSVDDRLTIKLSDFRVEGHGVIGAMAAAVLRGKTDSSKPVHMPLVSFGDGALVCADVELNADAVAVTGVIRLEITSDSSRL
jgi:hypothetical protein